MLNRRQAEINLRFFGYRYKGKKYGNDKEYEKALLRLQKTYKLPQTGKLDKKTDSLLVKKIKDLENMLYFLGHDVVVSGKFDKKDRAGVMAIQKKHKPKSYRKYKGIIDGPTWDTIKYYYKKKKNKKRYFFQNMDGSLNWKTIERHGFKKIEFKCHCGGRYCNGYPHSIDPNIIYVAIKLRRKFGEIEITSGERCSKWNSLQSGSSSTSTHMLGKAIDFVVISGKHNKSTIINYCYKLKHVKYSYSNSTNMGNAVHVNV